MNKDELKALQQGFLQLGISAMIYIMWIVLGFISALTIGLILPQTIILMWLQGGIILFTNLTGIYFSYDFLSDKSKEEEK